MTPTTPKMPFLLAIACLLGGLTPSGADERLEGIACRSVHLGYPEPGGARLLQRGRGRPVRPRDLYHGLRLEQGLFRPPGTGQRARSSSCSRSGTPSKTTRRPSTKTVGPGSSRRMIKSGSADSAARGPAGKPSSTIPWEVGRDLPTDGRLEEGQGAADRVPPATS